MESFKGNKNVVVYFYPKDNTPGCSKEACKFRDLKDEYDALECVVLGVSADHEVSHGKFIAKFGLNFSLLADTDRSLIKSYGASKAGDKIQRSTVLIGKDGKVAAVWNPVYNDPYSAICDDHTEYTLISKGKKKLTKSSQIYCTPFCYKVMRRSSSL
ncbi:unnamed protein product [Ascophyllum nodosum]